MFNIDNVFIILGYKNITINVSTSLRYIGIWFYIAAALTNTRVIHADYKYEKDKEIGINKNNDLAKLPFFKITQKQFEFLELFFPTYSSYTDFFAPNLRFDENKRLINTIKFSSFKNLQTELIAKRKATKTLSRGIINGFVQKLNKLSALNLTTKNFIKVKFKD